MSGKVQLDTSRFEKERRKWRFNSGLSHSVVTWALPFYRGNSLNSRYVHRVRSGITYMHNGSVTHTGLTMWCGAIGSIGGPDPKWKAKGQLSAKLGEGEVLCATCEGRAIGAGMDGARTINGRDVIFSPRTPDAFKSEPAGDEG